MKAVGIGAIALWGFAVGVVFALIVEGCTR